MKIIKYNGFNQSEKFETEPVDGDYIRAILSDVKEDGDAAVRKYSMQFDGVNPERLEIGRDEFLKSLSEIDVKVRAALEMAASNLRRFAECQMEQFWDFEFTMVPGLLTGQRVIPVEKVGVYVPGGNYPLVSSLLMGAVPARVAGVSEIVVCTPPGPGGELQPEILAAAAVAEIDRLYVIGGVQGIGAMAYGTGTVTKVDKIVGPGNRYVTAAKKEVYGEVGIDFLAGPSEVMVIADRLANPEWIAADLLAQAEHDTMAVPLLVTPSEELARRVNGEVHRQLTQLTTSDIASRSIENQGRIILVENLEEAVELANRRAPEHLELQIENPERYTSALRNYGTLFVGGFSAEVLGDYSSGLNHILPTGGAARYTGGLSVRDFIKVVTILKTKEEGFREIAENTKRLARLEGLDAHNRAVEVRMRR